MAALKILMVNHPQSARFRGGDTTQMVKTAEALRRMGHAVQESVDAQPDAAGFDLSHVFNIRTINSTPAQVQSLRRSGRPVVMSPIYLNPGVALWAARVTRNIFGSGRSESEMAALLEEFAAYRLKVSIGPNQVWEAHTPNRGANNTDQIQRDMLAHIAHLIPNSVLEMNALVKALHMAPPFTTAYYAADSKDYLDADPEPFVKEYGVKDFVLQVGRIEESKNQLMLVHSLRKVGLPIVLIGGSLQPQYLELCKRYGPPDLRIIPHLPTAMLRHAYAAARVHALPSWIETCGLVTMEAALANCNIVTSIAGYELEYYRDYGYYCNPASVESIRQAVVSAYENYDRDGARRAAMKKLILEEFTWEKSAQACLAAYRKVLG